MNPCVIAWTDPPKMECGAPLPRIKFIGDALFIAYICHNPKFPGWESGANLDHPGFDVYSAVLRFEGVVWHHFGAPNDEYLHEHEYYPLGLRCYGFWEILNSPRVSSGGSAHHWIVTFHDETLEVVANSAAVITPRVEGEETYAIVEQYSKHSH